MGAGVANISTHVGHGVATNGNQTPLSPASRNLQLTAFKNQARNRNTGELGSSHARSVQQLYYGPIPQSEEIGAINRIHKAFNLIDAKAFG